MLRNIRKKWLNSIPFVQLNLAVTAGFLGLSTYLDYTKPISFCAFCLTLRLLLVALSGLSLGAFLKPIHRRTIYPTQLGLSVVGLLLSLRQLYFESWTLRLVSCPRKGSNALQGVFNWLAKGAPACKKTYLVGPFSLTAWACLAFAIMTFIAFELYYKPARRR